MVLIRLIFKDSEATSFLSDFPASCPIPKNPRVTVLLVTICWINEPVIQTLRGYSKMITMFLYIKGIQILHEKGSKLIGTQDTVYRTRTKERSFLHEVLLITKSFHGGKGQVISKEEMLLFSLSF